MAAELAGRAMVTLAVNGVRARRDRRRELYAQAFAAVTAYGEYPGESSSQGCRIQEFSDEGMNRVPLENGVFR